jgi:ABC-type nickel/cobalt efflux system permease component RcnA
MPTLPEIMITMSKNYAEKGVFVLLVILLCWFVWSIFYNVSVNIFASHVHAHHAKYKDTQAVDFLTKEEQNEYKMYLMEVSQGDKVKRWDQWKLSKVFTITLSELEIQQNEDNK